MAYPFVRLLLLVGFTETPHSFGDTRFWMHFRIWQTMFTLDGIIEADETFFAISYKGNHSKSKTFAMPRKAHKRGHSTHIKACPKKRYVFLVRLIGMLVYLQDYEYW